MSLNNSLKIIYPIIIGSFAALTYYIGSNQSLSNNNRGNFNQKDKLQHIMSIIENRYVDSTDKNLLIENSIIGMLEELDPHSTYIPKKKVAQANESLQGHFGGVGIRFIILRDTLMITEAIYGGPSYNAGLEFGDRILSVDDEDISGINLNIQGVLDRLKGKQGTKVKLETYNINTKQTQITHINRGAISIPSIDASYMINNNIGYIKLSSFSGQTSINIPITINELKKLGMTKLILDLRDNGGGYLFGAVSVADEFLESDKLIVYTEGLHQDRNSKFATPQGVFEKGDLVILVNSNSASASEIVSGAIQDNDRGYIIGRRTFGKGLVQQPITLEDSSELRLTISRYFTPTGRCIQKPYGKGVDYNNELYKRYENGEMEEIDSNVFLSQKKFTTPKGKTVYGGGGIFPDIFIPIDTTRYSHSFAELLYSPSFRNFSFDYVYNNYKYLQFKDIYNFSTNFNISEEILEDFLKYAKNDLNINLIKSDIIKDKKHIANRLKADISSYLFGTSARYFISLDYDEDFKAAMNYLLYLKNGI